MTRSIFNVFSRLLSLALAAACCAPLAAQTIVFENVRPVDVESAITGKPTSVHARDGWIVGAASEGGDEVQRIDASGQYLIPGLAEMHAHVPSSSDCKRLDAMLDEVAARADPCDPSGPD